MAKVHVNGPETDAAWQFAKEALPGNVAWNFAGIFVVDATGTVVGRYGMRELSKVEQVLADQLAG